MTPAVGYSGAGFSCLDMSKPDVYQFTALAMHDFGGSFARFESSSASGLVGVFRVLPVSVTP